MENKNHVMFPMEKLLLATLQNVRKKCLNVRQKLGTRNVIENLRNLQIDPWDTLNNFCFHDYAQKSLFIAENYNVFLGHQPHPHHPPL